MRRQSGRSRRGEDRTLREESSQSLRRIQFPNAIAPEIPVEKVEEVREEEPRGGAVEPEQEKEEKRNCDYAIRQAEQIGVAEVAATEEEVIPKCVDEQNRADQSERGASPRRSRQEKEPAKNRETDQVVESADHHPAPERNGIRRQTETGEMPFEAATRQAPCE